MQKTSREFSSSRANRLSIRVYYEDTDAAGVVYYANYLRFCERARTEWLRVFGFSQQALMDGQGIAFVVRRVEASYLLPARLDDELEVLTDVVAWRGASLTFMQRVERGGLRLFEAVVQIACLDLVSQRPIPLPAAVRACLAD